MFFRLILSAIVLLLCPLRALGQVRPAGADEVEMLFRNWTIREGLPQDHIRVMTGTRDGFLWLGTDAGLARFDGVTFKTYGLREGLGAITVLALYEADDGTLWVATQGGGVSAIRHGRVAVTYGRQDGLPFASVATLGEDAEHHLWVANLEGLARLENGRFVPEAGPEGRKTPVSRLFHEKSGALWMALPSSAVFRREGGNWVKPEAGGPQTATVFCEDDRGRVWIGDAENRIWCRDAGAWTTVNLPPIFPAALTSMTVGPDGTLWMAFYRAGICGLRHNHVILPSTGAELLTGIAETVFVSPDGQLWMGSSTRGLYSLTPRRIQVARVDQGSSNPAANFIGALGEVGAGKFLIGTQGRGYFIWQDGTAHPVENDRNLSRGAFGNTLLRLRDGRFLAGGSGGILEYRDDSLLAQKISPTPWEVWELREDRGGGLWAGQGNGTLVHIDGGRSQQVQYGGHGDPIKGMAQESDGTLWVGTRGNGLFRLKDGQSRRFGITDGITEVIRVLYLGHDGTLWAGTAGGGLAVRHGERFQSFTTREGLPDDVVSQITEDDTGRLWLGTNRGLAIFSPEETVGMRAGKAGELHPLLLNRADGLLSQECTITPPVRTGDGRLAFATTDGFAMLAPQDFQADPRMPPVFIEEVLVNGVPVEMKGGGLSLPPGAERLEVRFTGLHFGAPERLRFRNKLVGLEETWGPAGSERRVEYRNLGPGHYRFELSGTIGNGLWSPPVELEIELQPHFWETTWCRVLVVLCTLGLVVLAVRRRERLRSRRKIEALKREQAVQAERARIARDLHDDVGASLTQVALLSELAQGDLTNRPDRASGHINEIFTTAKDVTRALDEIVWAVNPAHDTLESFATFLGAFVQNYARSAGLTARLAIPATLPVSALSSASRHHLYLATKEVLHNVVKHAQATEIRLSLAIETESFRITLEDNGRGLDAPAMLPGADGLENLQRRLEQIGGTCTWHSQPGGGTRVEMVVPLVE